MANMKTSNAQAPAKPPAWWAVLLLAAILAALFWRSFLPEYVHFSNDGPLGMEMFTAAHLPEGFTGMWGDLNDLGSGSVWSVNLSSLLNWATGPIGFAKFLPPIALFVLGLGAWTFFRQLKLSPLAAVLGALAATLNTTFFASACWGVASQQIAIGMDFFALALVVSNTPATPLLIRWTRLALAGFAVGMNVMESSDIGAIFSVFVAAFVFYKSVTDESGSVLVNSVWGIGRVALVAAFAGFIALQTVISLVGVSIQGVAGMSQDTESKAEHWNWATQWSMPKAETFGLFVPGVFGYRMDTPGGGNYWGLMGCDPNMDQWLANGRQGPPPSNMFRFSSCGGNYAGVLVTLLAAWAVAQSLRRKDSVFADGQRRQIWFWTAVLIGSLLLAYGRFAPFYKLFYELPYASTMRNPTKFLIIYSWAIVILFAYGVHGLSRRYLENVSAGSSSLAAWWAKVRGFDRKWAIFCAAAVVISALGWLIYASEKPALASYIQAVGFGDEGFASDMAAFSIGQAGWFVLYVAAAAGLSVLVIAGVFNGKRAKVGGFLLGALLLADLGRANLPYVIHWDYKFKYEVGSLNPIVDFLRNKPYEHRVAELPFPVPSQMPPPPFDGSGGLYRIEWSQHLFPYYNVQSLDVIQRPRVGSDTAAYETALLFRGTPETFYLLTRRWQLANVQYFLGAIATQLQMGNVETLQFLNDAFDPAQHRFRIVQRFNVVPKPGVTQPTQLADFTAMPDGNGNYALFEFTGALPRVKLYSNWQITTNDTAALQTLASTNFDAWKSVVVDTPSPATAGAGTGQNTGTVEFTQLPSQPHPAGRKM